MQTVLISEKDYIIEASDIQKLEEIEKGSFGVVYKGLLQGFNEVTIKELCNQSVSQTAQTLLENEIQIAQKLKHPNIIVVYGFCLAPLYLVMEYMPQNLFNLLHSEIKIPWELRYNISLDIVLGLEYIHEKNILHRNLKSKNVLLDTLMRAKITDFGLSREKTESKFLVKKQQMGQSSWMAPELMSSKPKYSKQSDIFALGVVF